MKFFTRDWADGDMTDAEADAVAPAYWHHLDALDLPTPVRALADLNTHDANVLDVGYHAAANTLRLRLRCGDQQTGYFDATLTFTGATIRPADAATLERARRPANVEVLYDEVDRADGRTFEYRLLLYPAGEVSIRFTDVAIVRKPAVDRRAV